MGLLIVDIDHCKRINDTCGHRVGDEVLKNLAVKMTAALRLYDPVGRWGGEEFLALLPSCTLNEAAAVAERLRLHVAVEKLALGQLAVAVTVRVGVYTIQWPTVDVDVALQAVDRALYEARHKGRNRVEIYDPASVADPPSA